KLSCRDAGKKVVQFEEVIECHAVAGEDDLLLKTRTATPLDLQELLDKLKTFSTSRSPRLQVLLYLSEVIQSALSPVQEGYTRLWRGNRPGEEKTNPSYTNSLEGIALPFWASYSGKLSYVDICTDRLSSYLFESGSAPDSEFVLPVDELKKVMVIPDKVGNIDRNFILKCLQFSQDGGKIDQETTYEKISRYTRNREGLNMPPVPDETGIKGWSII
ncbi:MAG: Lrp/AsnC ligand binding domain-containing protein, partial [Candidatus Doudnabacteria bacterium]|nr:Lrp/AsnC ligand binding domain-containing protein [Candidatus Doudnabacteria bacterium]